MTNDLNIRGRLGNYKIPAGYEWLLQLELKTVWFLGEQVEIALKRTGLTVTELNQLNELDDVLTDVLYYYEKDEK